MAKVTVVKEKNYTTIDNGIFKDTRISFKAKGLLTTMLSLPPTWNYTIEGLATLSKDGRDSIKTALKELEKFGYLERKQVRNDNGSFCDLEYFVYEKPQPKEPLAENPPADKSLTENHKQLSTNISSTDKSNTDGINTKRLKTDDKYALKDVKKSSFKGDMYASVSEEQEAAAPKKQSRYIPSNYTEEQLIEHIRPTIEENLKTVQEDCGMEYNQKYADDIIEIVTDFFEQYREKTGRRHKILPDATLINIMYQYFNPPECLWNSNEPSTYSDMAEEYFNTNFNARGGYDGQVTLSISHFMSNKIRENCYQRIK